MSHQTESLPIIDLHCDLLGCIAWNRGKLHFNSKELNCSIPQLIDGNVKLQVLAVSAITEKGSSSFGKSQVNLYKTLLETQSDRVGPYKEFTLSSPKLHFLFGIENASAILDEEEDLDLFFTRIDNYRHIEKILYISLTWNQENRFGGGNLSSTGLKEDGKTVLHYLNGTNIAIDLSHTSDKLAYDILNEISRYSLKIPVIASHSNYRKVYQELRNLPEELAKEIIYQKGLIGLNFVHRFVGSHPEAFIDHIQYALSIEGEDAICLGSDFYGGIKHLSPKLCPGKTPTTFFKSYENASCYPHWINLLSQEFSQELLQKICFQNVMRFLGKSLSP